MEKKKWFFWLAAMLIVGLVAACSSSSNKTPLGGEPTTLGNTVYTDAVITDGTWTVWEGRKQNLMFYNGSSTIDLSSKLGAEYSLGSDNETYWSGIGTDGRFVIFLANDVTDAAPFQPFAIDTQASGMPAIQIGELTDESNVNLEEATLADGIFAWVMDSAASEPEIFYYKLTDASPVLTQLTDNLADEYNLVISGTNIAWIQDGDLWYADLAAAVPAPEQATESGNVHDLVAADGIVAWIDGTDVWYVVGDEDPKMASVSTDDSTRYSLTVGNGHIAWSQNTEILYHDVTQAAETVHTVVTGLSSLQDFGIGEGFIAWSVGGDFGASYDGYIYTIGDEPDSEVAFFTDSSSYSNNFGLIVNDQKIFYLEDLENTGDSYPENHNPSAYLQVYDAVAGTTAPADDADYQRILMADAAGDKAVWFGHAANRTLYAKKVSNLGAPIALTPPEMNARHPRIDNGIVVFQGMDRTAMDGDSNGDDVEIYYCKLNASGRPVIRVTDDFFRSEAPRISGNLILWNDYDISSSSWYHNISTGVTTELTEKGTNSTGGATDGSYIAWRDGSNIHYFDTTTEIELVVTTPGNISKCPSLAAGLVTWVGYNGSSYSIYSIDFNDPALDLEDLEASIVTIGPADSSSQRPETDGRYIVWGGVNSGYSDNPINYYDTKAETPAVVTLTADNLLDVCNPRLSNGLIIWAAVEYGVASVDGDREIFAYDLNAAVPEVVQLTDNDLWDSQPEVSNGVVTWRTGGSSQWDWYGKLAAALSF